MPWFVRIASLFLIISAAAEEDTISALIDDDQCGGSARENCSLTMLQVQGKRTREAAEAGWWGSSTCESIGCDSPYSSWQSCQCNEACEEYGSCCEDYVALCNASSLLLPPRLAGGGVHGHPSPSKLYPQFDGFTLALVEEFDEPLDLDKDPIWTWSDGGLIEGQIRFVKEAITFSNGTMRIETSPTKQGQHTEACSHAEVEYIKPKEMTSGELRTRHNLFRYGRYEASIRAPQVQPGNSEVDGNYVATLFVFRDAKYKHWREIDIEITGDHPDSMTTNVLSADNTVRWSSRIAESKKYRMKEDLRSSFHTFAFEWLPHRISWYFDGKLIREKTGGHVPISDISAKVMMNLWVFDHRALFGGPKIKNNGYPMYSEYDWFRFYKWDDDHDYPCPGFNTSCLTAGDMFLSGNNPCDNIAQDGTVHGRAPCQATCHQTQDAV